jgi:hypothetical protein
MNKRFSFFLWGLVIVQLLTAAFHSLSFVIKTEPANETERQLTNLMETYHIPVGMGFSPTTESLFLALSSCFTFICLLAAISNWYLKKKQIGSDVWKGLLLIQTIVFGAMFLVMFKFTFLVPIVCTGLIFLFAVGSYLSVKAKS